MQCEKMEFILLQILNNNTVEKYNHLATMAVDQFLSGTRFDLRFSGLLGSQAWLLTVKIPMVALDGRTLSHIDMHSYAFFWDRLQQHFMKYL